MSKAKKKNTYANANSYDAAICFDKAGTVLECDQAFFELFDADEQALSVNFYSLMPEFQPDGRISQTFFRNQISHAYDQMPGSKGYEFTWLFKRSDGKYFQANVTLSKAGGSDGDYVVCHILAAYEDEADALAGNNKNRDADHESDAELATFLEHAPGIIFFIDENLNILDCNQFALDTFSLNDKDDFIDNFFSDFVPKFQSSFKADDLMRLHIKRANTLGSSQFDWNIKRDDEETQGNIKLVSTTYQGHPCCVAYLNELATGAGAHAKHDDADKPLENGLLGEHIWSLLDGMPFAWQFLEPDLTCIDCNLAAVRMFDYKDKQEFIDRYSEASPEFQPCGTSSLEKAQGYVKQALDEGLAHFEWMYRKADDTPIPCEVTLMRVGLEDRSILAAFVRDLREQKALEALKQNDDIRMRVILEILENIPTVVDFWDKNGNLMYCNNHIAEMLGIKDKSIYMQDPYKFSLENQPNGRNSLEWNSEIVKRVYETGIGENLIWYFLDVDGNQIPADCSLYRVEWGDDYAILEFCRDLREELKLQKEQLDSRERLLAIIDNLPAGIFICDHKLNILSHNSFMDGMLGLEDREMLSDFLEFLPENQSNGTNTLESINALLNNIFEKGGQSSFSFDAVSRAGEHLPLDCSVTRIPWGDGFAAMVFCYDTREQRSYEERLRLIVDTMPLACNFRDENFDLVDSNQAARDLFEVSSTEEYAKRILEFSPEFQPCGRPTMEKSNEYIKIAHEEGIVTFDWMNQKADGTPIPTEITLIRVQWQGRTMICTFLRDMREIIKNQNEQKAARERVLAMINASPMMCYVVDKDYNVLDCNDASPKLMGLDSKQDFLDGFYNLHPKKQPDGRTSVDAADDFLGRALKDGSSTFNWWFRKPDGELLPVESSASRVELDGQLLLVVYSRDLSESIKYEQEQIAARERVLAMVNASPMMCFICDSDLNILDCNDRVTNLLNWDSKQTFIDSFIHFFPHTQPDGRESQEVVNEYLESAFVEDNSPFEWTFLRADGELLPVEVSTTLTELDGRKVLIAYCRDLRESIKYEQEQIAARERVLAMVNASPMMCFICDSNLNILDCNDRVTNLLNWDSKQTFIDSFIHFFPHAQPDGRESREVVDSYLGNAFKEDNSPFEWSFLRADGELLPVEVSTTLTELDGRKVLIVYCRDLRESRKYEQEQIAARERVMAMVNASPMMCFICDSNLNILDCNDRVTNLLNWDSKQTFIDSFMHFFPHIQPNGRVSRDVVDESLGAAFVEDNSPFEWSFLRADGELLPVEVSTTLTELDGRKVLIVYCRDLRESRKYEQDQIAARERILAMVNASPMMCFVCDAEFNILDCNDRVVSLLGLESKQTFIDSFMDFHPETQPDGRSSDEAIGDFLRGDSAAFEWNFRRLDGEILPVEASATLTELDEQNVFIVYCRDMRDHYRYMNEQRVLRNRMEAIINAAPMVCYVINRNLEVVDCNISGEKFFEVGSYLELGALLTKLHPEHQPDGSVSATKMLELFESAFNTGSETFDWMHHSTSGEELPVEVHVRKVSVDGKEYCTVYLHDLRETIKFNEERRVARERIIAMLDASPLACSILDSEFNILICNESVVELFELKDKDEYISSFLQLHPDNQPDGRNSLEKLRENVARAFIGGSSVMTFEWMFQTLAGDLVPSEITLKPVTLDDKNLMIAYIQDLRHIKQAALAAEALEKLAYTDSLTGANNRRYFVDVAERELQNSITGDLPFTLIMLDIDDFKAINDTFGHVVGDGVLKILVSRIRHTLRKNVVVARYGGEEFVVMMPGIPEDAAERTAWRIRKNIEGSKFLVEGSRVPVTVSMGVAGRGNTEDSLTDIIVKADRALYQAKASGKNTVVQYDESMVHQFSEAPKKREEKRDEKQESNQEDKRNEPKGGKKQNNDR